MKALGVRSLLLMAFLTVVGVVLTILAAAVVPDSDATVLVPLLFYAFTPVPVFLCGLRGQRQQQSLLMQDDGLCNEQSFTNVGHWLCGLFGAAGPCAAIVLFHVSRISGIALGLSLVSGLLLAGAAAVVVRAIRLSTQEEDAF